MQLAEPLIACARDQVSQANKRWLPVAMDWCNLHLKHHDSKADRVELANAEDVGYEMLTALALSDRDGSAIAPLCLELRAADGVRSTRTGRLLPPVSPLDALAPVMAHIQQLGLGPRPVFIIDREADSVAHYRQWDARGYLFVVRADNDRLVLHAGQERRLDQVTDWLKQRKKFRPARWVRFKGKLVRQFVAETTVVLHRPARSHRVDPKTGLARHYNIAGPSLALRLVISEIRNGKGKVLARWLLLTNLPPQVKPATVALWYYWRWEIESYHKLLKGTGQQVESWQQETAAAMSRRLLVAAMAAVMVWRLARNPSPQAARMREALVRLSGRQMKRGKHACPFTEPALLAGLGILIPMLDLLMRYEVRELRALARATLPPTILPFLTDVPPRESG